MEPEYIERKALDKALTAAASHDKDKNRRTWAKATAKVRTTFVAMANETR